MKKAGGSSRWVAPTREFSARLIASCSYREIVARLCGTNVLVLQLRGQAFHSTLLHQVGPSECRTDRTKRGALTNKNGCQARTLAPSFATLLQYASLRGAPALRALLIASLAAMRSGWRLGTL